MLPEDIINNIMLFHSHPIADIMKESSIFKYRELREISIEDDWEGVLDCYSWTFNLGCEHGWENDYNANCILSLAQDGRIEWDEVADCAKCYDIGFMHTLYKLNDDADFDYKFKYSIKPINTVGTNQRINHYLKNQKLTRMDDYIR